MFDAPGSDAKLDLVPDAVLIVDAGGRITYANRNCQALLGWSPEQLLGESVERLVPGRFANHAAKRNHFMAAPSRRPMGAGLELFALHRIDGEIPVDIALNPVTIEGAPHVVVALRDMRAYRMALHNLDMLSVAVDAAASGVVITDPDGVITWVNPAACHITGYAASELIGRRTSLLKSGRHDKRFYDELWATIRAGSIWRGAIINRHKNGAEYHEEQTIAPVRNNAGAITQYIAIKQDVTERVRAENLLRDTRDELARRVTEVESLHARLREQAIRDSLSGLFNRRYLDETLPRELAKADRDRTRLTLVMIDIDNFKQVNDANGHAAGDRMIASLGGILKAQSRICDIACRYGGEEFAVVVIAAELQDGVSCAEDWRKRFCAASLSEGGTANPTTLSAGVVQWIPGETAAELIARADAALYEAKRTGRNRVVSG